MRQQRLDQEERRFQIGLQQQLEIVLGDILDHGTLAQTGIVDENVETRRGVALGQFSREELRQYSRSAGRGEIGLDHKGGAAGGHDFGHGGIRRVSLRMIMHGDDGAVACQPPRDGPADAAARSGHQCGFSGQRGHTDQPCVASRLRARSISVLRSILLVPAHGNSLTNWIRRGCW